MSSIMHSGDLGDIIYAIPAMKALSVDTCHYVTRSFTKPATPAYKAAIRGLLAANGITLVGEEPKEKIIDCTTFRSAGLPYGKTLSYLQSKYLGVPEANGSTPWLSSDVKDIRGSGRIIVHRSPRYNNNLFPWGAIGRHFGDRLLAFGYASEIECVRKALGFQVEHVQPKDLQEAANIIAGSDGYIGNQSSPMALAVGLGVPFLQEVCSWTPDCIFPNRNAWYSFDGAVKFLGWNIDPIVLLAHVNTMRTPRGGWQAISDNGKEVKHDIFGCAVKLLVKHGDATEHAERKLRDYARSTMTTGPRICKYFAPVANILLAEGYASPRLHQLVVAPFTSPISSNTAKLS